MAQIIKKEKWSCKYLLRLVLIMQKEATKRQPLRAGEFLVDTVSLLQSVVDSVPWTKVAEPVWLNLRHGFRVFFGQYKKEEAVRELF